MNIINVDKYLPILSYPDHFFRQNINYIPIKKNFNEQRKMAETAREYCRSICQAAVKNSDEFPYIYFTAGATEGINHFFNTLNIQITKNEYRYVQTLPHSYNETADGIFYSYPFSGSGKLENLSSGKKSIVDLTYLFATEMTDPVVLPQQTMAALFSLSKSHNLADLRVGWMLSKTIIPSFHVLQYDYGYINSILPQILTKVSSEKLNYLYLKYNASLQRLYKNYGLDCPDTNLFGIDSSGKRIPYYSLLKQGELLENI